MANKSFSDEIIMRYASQDPLANCRNVTFQVTDDCCLKCSYCYQGHKGHAMMTNEIGKAGIDLLFKMYDENKEDTFINKHTYGIILDFIGGEPFMNVEAMDAIAAYFFDQCFERDHIWLTNSRISVSSNGILYFSPEVQKFIKKYKSLMSLTITIDGPKSIHDLCRVDYDGNGSYDRAIAAWNDWFINIGVNAPETKITIAPENLHFLEDVVDFFLKRGCNNINANPIFEHKWTLQEAQEYFIILIHIADKLLEKEKVHSSLFNELKGKPLFSTDTNNYCGGTALMLAFNPRGKAYPCLRYMESSIGNDRKPIIIGDVNGIYDTPETIALYNDMKKVTRQSQSSPECINCHVASGCGYCSAWNYQETGSYNRRSVNICWMHRAESLANVYYWNKYYIKNNIPKRFPMYLTRDVATQFTTDEVYDNLLRLSQLEIRI